MFHEDKNPFSPVTAINNKFYYKSDMRLNKLITIFVREIVLIDKFSQSKLQKI